AGVKRIERFYRDFPLGKTVETPWGETVVFSPLDVDKTEEYIHHFAVKRTRDANGVYREEFSESFLGLFKKLEESLRNADDRILAVSKDGAPRVCYLKKLGEKNQNHYMVCSVDMDGRIHAWTHMESKDSYIKNQLNREKQAIDQYGLIDKDGLPVNITYQEYLAKKKDIPLYLATAEAHQVLSPQMEASDRANNINGNPDLSSANEKKNQEYSGSQTSGRTATAAKAMLVSFVISALIAACGKAWYDFSTRNREKSKKDEEKNPAADYVTECLVSAVGDLFDIDPFAGSAVNLIYSAATGSISSTDKNMFGDDYLRALQKSYQAGKAITSDEPQKSGEKSVEEKVYDAAASDLQAMGVLSPGFQVTGAALKQSKRLWDLWVGGEREAVTPQKTPQSRLYRRRRRKRRFY
ncbi:MAG: hypothetical protein MJ016_07145, partial [Victivallaceae bacterium]|nr:hypothetical protein [Victivallaceae bacterium]